MTALQLHACCKVQCHWMFSLNVFHFVSYASSTFDYILSQLLPVFGLQFSCTLDITQPPGSNLIALPPVHLFLSIFFDGSHSSTPLFFLQNVEASLLQVVSPSFVLSQET
jgi:hypothetical protein